MCSYTLIEHVEENDMNLSQSTKCCSQKEINLFQANVDKSFDEGLSADLDLESISHEMLKGTSPHYIENNQVIKEEYFGSLNINDLSKLRDSFNFLTSNSYFSIYLDLFFDFDMLKIPSELPNYVASKLHFDEISNIDYSLIKHEFEGLGHISLLNHHSIQCFKERRFITRWLW